ncbi:MAG TPA: hypothetical protein VKP89_12615 [Burkholderiales bacterium]|nr:hypothetical protein [Burkholderiales bacterium]
MQRIINQFLALLLISAFAALAVTALAAPLSAGKAGAQQQQQTVDKAFCKKYPSDPRCKDVK